MRPASLVPRGPTRIRRLDLAGTPVGSRDSPLSRRRRRSLGSEGDLIAQIDGELTEFPDFSS